MFAVLELNDQLLQIQAENSDVYQESGFARLNPDGIETGEAARASAWREPQNSFNQYWRHLNQTTLAGKHKWARHHADIAFAQLRNLWQNSGEPDDLMVLIPGCFTNTQLSLLLGMVNALPCRVNAVVDNALLACLRLSKETLFVDLQLHQAVISRCRPENSVVKISEQEIIPDLGMMQVLNRVSRHISNLLIQSFRYDPLHASDSEQYIYDHLPSWLGRLAWEDEISASLPTPQGELPFILTKNEVQHLMKERLGNMHSIIARYPAADLSFSYGSRLLIGLFDEFSRAEVAAQSIAIDNGLLYQDRIIEQAAGLHRMTSFDLGEFAPASPADAARLATHLLFQDQALSLHQPVSIHLDGERIRMEGRTSQKAALTLVLRNRAIEVIHQTVDADMELNIPAEGLAGEVIVLGSNRFKLIEVLNG